jgi:hypothetical protein
MSINSKYTFDDTGIRQIQSRIAKLTSMSVKVGVVGPNADNTTPTGGDLAMWQLAAIQEFGTNDGHIPERSFIRKTLNDLVWLRSLAQDAAKKVVMEGQSTEMALDWMGSVIATAIQRTLISNVPPPNTDATVEWKGHGDTLIGLTGALFDAISHEVVSSGGEKIIKWLQVKK